MKQFCKVAFIISSLAALVLLILGTMGNSTNAVKFISSSGIILALAGAFQLDVSGLFDKLIEKYGDEEKYPFGPPSIITREIIDNPSTPIRTTIRNLLFFNTRTGFWQIVIGGLLQLVATWM